MSLIQKFIAAIVLFTSLILLGVPNAAGQTSSIGVLVTDSNGRPLSNVTVHLYDGPGKCKCVNQQCNVDPQDTKTTGANGTAMFGPALINGHDYTVCIDDVCQTLRQCVNPPNDCQFSGNCHAVRTPRRGGRRHVQIIRP